MATDFFQASQTQRLEIITGHFSSRQTIQGDEWSRGASCELYRPGERCLVTKYTPASWELSVHVTRQSSNRSSYHTNMTLKAAQGDPAILGSPITWLTWPSRGGCTAGRRSASSPFHRWANGDTQGRGLLCGRTRARTQSFSLLTQFPFIFLPPNWIARRWASGIDPNLKGVQPNCVLAEYVMTLGNVYAIKLSEIRTMHACVYYYNYNLH